MPAQAHQDPALHCFHLATTWSAPAVNLTHGMDRNRLDPPLRRAISLARKLGMRDPAALCLARKAAVYLEAGNDASTRLEAFSTLEELMRSPPTTAEAGIMAMRLISKGIEKIGGTLQLLLTLALGQHHLLDRFSPEVARLLPLLATEWNLEEQALLPAIHALRDMITDAEEERTKLLPPVPDDQARADWTDFTIFHPVLQRSMPFRQSFRKLANYQENLLAIQHELTHIGCMSSHVGNTLFAMRAALFETETDLWALLGSQGKAEMNQELFTRGLAPLLGRRGDPLALAYAERELDLALKASVVRETWAHWFEGLAVFAELHGDATDDEAISDMSTVIINLEDPTPRVYMTAEAAASAWLDRAREADQLYADAARAVGPFRLRAYLDQYANKYLPGYLAVRTVVAAWRRRYQGPLSGAQAQRALMHITKTGSDEAVPNLGLPLNDFRTAAVASMRGWLDTIANVSAADLARLLSSYTRPETIGQGFSWRNGRLIGPSADPSGRDAEKLWHRRLDEALSTLAGANGPAERVGRFDEGPADRILKGYLETVAESLQGLQQPPKMMSFGKTAALMGRYSILPIAETSAPFWLNVPTQTLVTTIHVGTSGATGGNLYSTLCVALTPGQFESLRAEANLTGAARLTVTRVAELGDLTGEQGATRGLGANYLAFRLGNWMHILPAGMLMGRQEAPPQVQSLVRQRLFPNPAAIMEEGVTALATHCANRTSKWLANVDSWGSAGNEHPLQRWAQYVSSLAGEVMLGQGIVPEQADSCARALLSFVFGAGRAAEDVAAGGLAMGDPDRSWFTATIRLLALTGNAPVTDLPGDARLIPREIFSTIFELGNHGWDVRVPTRLLGDTA